MDTTMRGIGKMLGNDPDEKKVLYVAAQMLREDPCDVGNKIFALQFYMGMVASLWEFAQFANAFESVYGTSNE